MVRAGMRRVCFAGRSVQVDYDSKVGERVVEFLYADISERADVEPHVTLRISTHSDREPASLSVFLDDKRLYHGTSVGALASRLVGETIYHIADKSDSGLVLHAAAVSRGGVGMMLPGRTGAGKTTLTAWLIHSGINYLTDELVFIAQGSTALQAFTRPLNLKAGSLGVIGERLSLDTDCDETLACAYATLVPHRLINPEHRREAPQLRVVVFPEFRREGELSLQRLSKAQTGMRLMECLVNARNLPGHGFGEVTRVARCVQAYALHYSSFDQLGVEFERLLDDVLAA